MNKESKDDSTPTGSFVWHDLVTRDIDASRRFYEALFGWRVDRSETNGSHVVLSTTDEIVAGLVPLGENDELMNRWIAYVGVDDAEEVPARALRLEGEVPVRGELAVRSGRFSVITDPRGASIAAIDGDFPTPEDVAAAPPHGAFCWHEVVTADPEQTKSFYGDVFDWGLTCVPRGEEGLYWMFLRDRLGVAGVRPAPELPGQRSFWLCYLAVRDVDETALLAEQLEGNVLTEPLEVPRFGRFATLADPLGGVFAVLTNERK